MDEREQSVNTMHSGKEWFLLDCEGIYRTYWYAEVAMSALLLCRYSEDPFQFQCTKGTYRYASGAPEAPFLVNHQDVPLSLRHVSRRRSPI
tara:strand:+ start:778 stop:1050 length:273 start_codon:yes stop_codon:yes gene_type:complete